ncbi:hypothetical protein SAMN06893096_104433 [Geodermatophilus pulveris]|uniref:Alpha/beta hydrolase family protein n=1 Tax=Geodermatophilus pulveris TaxID=1564159 RepID=A0A239F4Q2_9ACTN|nr:hypothetical protein [Geodermatophilus pulveris]SNS51084.1 hypothetical protein SAMN06893096_104433 [Geodermatophilus pulveris]
MPGRLVHPPLVGPAVLQPLAAELHRRGHTVAVPDLRAAVATAAGWPGRWVGAAAAAGPAEVVAGFSGAGLTLPAVAVAVSARRVVWVDAVLPTGTWPDERVRAAVLAEGHRLPADLYDVAVPVPDRWPDHGARYVHLSPAYDAAAAAARARGWTVVGDGTGQHLDVATDPRRVADLLG